MVDNVIQSWAFLESVLPGEIPSLKDKIKGDKFEDGRNRKRVNSLELSKNLWETVRPANPEKYNVTFTYYIDSYEQNHLVQLLRTFFNSDEEIVNRNNKLCYSFAFKVNEKGEYVKESLFIPHLQLIIHDIETKQSIDYKSFIARYDEAKKRVEEAAGSIFSNGVHLNRIQELRQIFYRNFSTPHKKGNQDYVEIVLENKSNANPIPMFNSFYFEDLQQILNKDPNSTLQQFIEGKPLLLDIDENKDEIQKM
jgi:hypothetical protein